MKRDLDLIREILLAVEVEPPGSPLRGGDFGEQDVATVAAHVELLIEAGYVDGLVTTDGRGDYVKWRVLRLTMDGHDFLDAIRDPVVYRETKSKLAKVGGATALEAVKAVAQGVVNSMLGLS
jgi:hypothetical protein